MIDKKQRDESRVFARDELMRNVNRDDTKAKLAAIVLALIEDLESLEAYVERGESQ
jgi:hypothetical protein